MNTKRNSIEDDEVFVRGMLVREIRDARTWEAMKQAADALFQVRLRAKSMLDEALQHEVALQDQANGADS